MGYEVCVCPECERAVVELTGRVNGQVLVDALDRLTGDDAWSAHLNELWDLRDVTEIIITADQLARLEAHGETEVSAGAAGRLAMLARSVTQESYGSLLHRHRAEHDRSMRIFRLQWKALDWLGWSDEMVRDGENEACACRAALP